MDTMTIELTSADPAVTLFRLQNAGIILLDVDCPAEFTLRFRIARTDAQMLFSMTQKYGEDVKVLQKRGLVWLLRGLLHRPVLVLGVSMLLMLSLWVPGRIFFVQVQGNTAVPTARILEAAADCGITFGASSRQVRSQQVKNALLAAIPTLQWAGINTNGCVAIISVGESEPPQSTPQDGAIGSIVAVCDGVIRELTVLRGTAQCAPGQAVSAGQTLISAYTDCGICLRADRAQGDVWAYTKRVITMLAPTKFLQRGENQCTVKKYSLIIGKKRINFANSSGILGSTCAKIYSERYLTLPGGFQLPLAVAVETWTDTTMDAMSLPSDSYLGEAAANYLREQILGSILTADTLLTNGEDYVCLHGVYGCSEMIGRFRPEENLPDYESD